MIYLVSLQQELFESSTFKHMSVEDSISLIKTWKFIQFDTETSGRDVHLCSLLCAQFGYQGTQIVVDCTTIDIKRYKEVLENGLLILQNAKFDLQFLYCKYIIPRKVYDTMLAEQVLYLGYPYVSVTPEEYNKYNYTFPYNINHDIQSPNYGNYELSFSLKAIAYKYLKIDIDKTIRGEIIWRGLDEDVIKYAAGDVMYLEDIMKLQLQEAKEKDLIRAIQIECEAVPWVAYLEWCGIHLNQDKWLSKMKQDKLNLTTALNELNNYAKNHHKLQKWVKKELQGDLFLGFDDEPKWTVDWQKAEAMNVVKALGFNTTIQDKKTGEDKDSIMEKHLKSQKGIDDTFLKLYFDYQGYFKVCSSFGQGHLDAINPKTNRIHTQYKQLGCASGRMSCGSQQNNTDLAKYKNIKSCTYPNMQQLPADEATRGSFTAPEGYLWSSCDYSALESRLGADIYNEKSMLDEFLYGSGDMHSLCAYMVYKDIIPRDTPIKDIKKLYPKQRKEVKGIEFSQQFGGSEYAIQGAMGCSLDEAIEFKDAYSNGFPGISEFKKQGSKFVRENGYILMCKYSGHKMYWWDHNKWVNRQKKFTQEFWEDYRINHKGTGDSIAKEVSQHFKAASKWDRMALNSPTQGSGIVILKIAMTNFFNWIVDNGYFGKVELAAAVHDETNIIYPKELTETPIIQQKCMEEAAALVCTKLPIPAVPDVDIKWNH